ncbi:MAG: YjjG family noncanonical pyrimidine nucleotidase [Chitinophagales bacterium]|nr:YjjG family noncanonical pyrimidine nucleotidase [Chitinophagales bacterium]
MKTYKHIFFDLDHTIWDFETNSLKALQQIFTEEKLAALGVPSFAQFHVTYKPINDRYWSKYHNGFATKEQVRVNRFAETLAEFGINNLELAERMAHSYVSLSPRMTALFPDAYEVLQYLQSKYSLHLITNGFAEVQWIKIENSGLRPFFEHIIISEEVGTQKPDKEIFEIAMNRAFTNAGECIMIGDNFNTDIVGARNAGMDQVYFNPKRNRIKERATYVVNSLNELKRFL